MIKKKTYNMTLTVTNTGRTLAPIPADIRDELKLENKEPIEVQRIGDDRILIRLKRGDHIEKH
jgi:bifunctional DNA-binding transcriptional regulator/antitoxin component of YhaV-PrlF toxin-antitoxin module